MTVLGFGSTAKEELETYLQQNKLLINLVILELNENNDVDMSIIMFVVAIGEILKMDLLMRDEYFAGRVPLIRS